MDLRQLRYFAVLADQRHFGRASRMLHLSQPALSRQIRLLEEEIGVRLFERHARGATPTEEALFLRERTSFLLRYAEQLKYDMLARRKQPQGPVVLGLSAGLAQLLAAPLMRAIRGRYPRVRLRIHEDFGLPLQTMLVQGSIDLAILDRQIPGAEIIFHPLLKESICLIGRPCDLKFSARRIRIRQLAKLPLIMTGIPDSGVRLEVDIAAAQAGVALNTVVEAESMQVAKRLVADGIGVTINFAAAVQAEVAAGRLLAAKIENLHSWRLLARSSVRPISRATEVMIDILCEVAQQLVRSGEWPNAVLEMREGDLR